MNAIGKFPKGTHFTLFSDSPEKLQTISRELWAKGYENTIDKSKTVLETFQEIAKCGKGFVGSNSTFAWWAAFFAYRSHKSPETYTAYFPDTWMANGHKPNLFTLPCTKALPIIAASDKLNSFSYIKLH